MKRQTSKNVIFSSFYSSVWQTEIGSAHEIPQVPQTFLWLPFSFPPPSFSLVQHFFSRMFERLTQKYVQTHFHSPLQILVQVEPLVELSNHFDKDKPYYTIVVMWITSLSNPPPLTNPHLFFDSFHHPENDKPSDFSMKFLHWKSSLNQD